MCWDSVCLENTFPPPLCCKPRTKGHVSFLQIWSLQALEERQLETRQTHSSFSIHDMGVLLQGPAASKGSYKTVWKMSLSVRNASSKEQKSLLL